MVCRFAFRRASTLAALAVACALSTAAGAADKPLVAPPDQWRAVHVMAWGLAGGPEAIGPLKEAIDKVLAPAGVNVIVFELGYNYQFKSHPELQQTKYITKAQAQDLARVCREHKIRLIPQLNCVGHQSWRNTLYPLLTQYREFEEPPDDTPDKRWTKLRSWCPLHPGVNPIVFALMDELLDAFGADAFHVGMDEILIIASKKCPRCKDKTPAEVLVKAVKDFHHHLVDERKVEMLMWGDRLIDAKVMNYNGWSASDNGTAPAVDMIPKDIIICDWHYDKRTDYPSVRYFQDKGFRVVPAGWNNVEATKALIACARRDATPRMLGYMTTSWCLEPGGYARALLGQSDTIPVSAWATAGATACRAALEELAHPTTK